LKRLGSARDEDVLLAAREAHAQISAAGVRWEDLLVPDGAGTRGPEYRAPDVEDTAPPIKATPTPTEDTTPPVEDAELPVEKGAKHAESLALIEKILARRGISNQVRREMKDYKDDIAGGEFGERDRRYILALYKRLSKNR